MTQETLLLFCNVSQPPYCNNLIPPVRAFQKTFRTTVVEPAEARGFVSTGGARPALIPDEAVFHAVAQPPDVVVCIGGGLHFSERARRSFPRATPLVGFALSDPYGLDASLEIAPEFDLFYTQDPQTLPEYARHGIRARRCDPATDPELYFPASGEPDCDVVFYGKWTPYRDALAAALAPHLRLRLHAYAGETRWSVPVHPPLDTPEALRAGLTRSRLALETALLDDAEGRYAGTFRITPRVPFAASCGVPVLVESFDGLADFLAVGTEVATFTSAADVAAAAKSVLADERSRRAMAGSARQRVLRDHTWDRRVASLMADLREWRAGAPVRSPR